MPSPSGLAILGSGIFAKEALDSGVAVLRAIYSRSEKGASELAKAAQEKLSLASPPSVYYDGDAATNLDALLARDDIHAVAVALPITLQPSIVRRALAAGKHVLSEKPVAPDVASGRELISEYNTTYKPKGLVWRVAENWELEPGYHVAAKAIRDGKIGKVNSFNVRAVGHVAKDSKWYNTPWRTVPDYQGGFVLDGGVHTAAALRIILPSPMATLSGFASQNQAHLPPHDTINAVVNTVDGVHGLVELSWGAPVPSRSDEAHSGISITGQEGWISVENTGRTLRVTVHTVTKDAQGRDVGEEKTIIDEPTRGVELEFASFFKAIDGDNDGFGDPLGALRDVAFIQAGLNSNGSPVDLIQLVQG
ncbi:hypothetical protein PHLGIDRAFT_22069 [Phlebiopsis gigantea 11061_1 CR5-6]|uniref:Gfo/Idh/MocA-like oxidoreductase N-terminal domain-containing protein n=1 Tax=Phlebiopsis gigantea (strain 11061_1 CR5-6) TaxID=745531 RepID=A0A0C3SCD5_PHLG1|nr:hypothetical protein PHLGIDRAFT_22069 [Phlebiopsis gigantea 11061_1 CR5-6]